MDMEYESGTESIDEQVGGDEECAHEAAAGDAYAKKNTYPGIDKGIVRIVRYLAGKAAGKCGLTGDDVSDLEQELIVAVLTGLENVDVTAFVPYHLVKCIAQRRLTNIFRHRSQPSRDWRKCRHSLNVELPGAEEDDGGGIEMIDLVDENHHLCLNDAGLWHGVNPADTRLDVADALNRLAPEQRRLCDGLQTNSQRQLAEQLEMPREWLTKELRKIASLWEDIP